MESNFKVMLGAMIDESSLSDVQKRIAKEKINLNANISIEDFSKSKLEIQKQVASLGTYIKTTLGDSVSDKQANQWAKQYYDSMINGAKQAAKEQDNLAKIQILKNNAIKKSIEEINRIEQLGTNKSKVTSLTNDLKNYTNESKLASDQIRNLQNAHNTLLTSQSNLLKGTGNETDLINSNKLLQEEYTKTANVLKNLKTEFGKGGSALAAPEQVSATISKINKYMSQNTNITKEATNQLNSYKRTLSEADVTKGALNDVKTGLAGIEAQMRELNKVGFSFADKFKNAITKFGGWALATGTVMQGVQKFKEAVSELKEVNTILTEISKANDKLSKSQLVDLGNLAFKKGSKYGKGASSYLSGIQEASRAGYTNADEIAELSVLAQSAGDMTAELANKYVIATDAAYKLRGETSKLNEVLDGQNYITNNNAVNMSELADATRVTASQAASSGVEIDKMTAAIGTMIAVTQDSGDTAGRAFKGILMNLQQVSGEVDATTGEIINDDDLRKYESAANDLGVQLKEVKDGYMALRDPMQILKDLSQAYTSLPKDDSRRANLISAIGGKYRGNISHLKKNTYPLYSQRV